MYSNLEKDLSELDTILEKVKVQGANYIKKVRQRSTSSSYQTGNIPELSEEGLGTEGALEQFNRRLEPLIVSSSGPRYLGFVTGGSTPASIAGDWLTSVYDQNTQTAKGEGDISAHIELETIKLLLELFELPTHFFGGFVTGATMSNFTCLAVARQWYGKKLGKDYAKEGIQDKINILSTSPHSSSVKSLAMLGLGSKNIIKINPLKGNREAMDIDDLENKIKQLQGEPFILISSAGTVNTVDFDNFEAIGKLRKKYRFWWHVDAAFGGFAACSPAHKHLLNGWEQADSITVDCHKWLNVPYENAFFLIREEHQLLQAETFQNSNAPYLGDPTENFSYLNFLPENSRRLKALPAWFTLTAYGKKGYREIVENSIEMTRLFGSFIEKNNAFELLAPIRLNTVCFTLSGEENQEKVTPFLTALNNTGKVFMTPTVYNGKKGIRAAFVNWMTDHKDIDLITEQMNIIVRNTL